MRPSSSQNRIRKQTITMSKSKLIFTLVTLTICVSAKNIDQNEEARFFRHAHTSTVSETQWITSIVPSSCIQVAPTLPTCRGMRFLNFPQIETTTKTNGTKENSTAAAVKEDQKVETTLLSWGEFLGIYAPTVTVTDTVIQTTIMENPNVVVTFSVVAGCRPSELPLGIDLCHPEYQQLAPSAASDGRILQTALPESVQQQPSNSLEPSNQEIPEETFLEPTENL